MSDETKALLAKLDKLIKAIEENTELLRGQWLYQMIRDEVPADRAGKLAKRQKALVLAYGQAYKKSKRHLRLKGKEANVD